MDIVVTLPKSVKWAEYEEELAVAASGGEIKYKVQGMPKAGPGDRCYVTHDGFVRGWMCIDRIAADSFKCSTTGRAWNGLFVVRTGKFHPVIPCVAMRGTQGFRYVERGLFTDV